MNHGIRSTPPARRAAGVLTLAWAMFAVCAQGAGASPERRAAEPVVLSGAELPRLVGAEPSRVVAFRYRDRPGDRRDRWDRVPVQVDERKPVDFGSEPPSNSAPGVEGTVYGTAPIGHEALQYADPDTFVGADTDPGLDADDELVFLSKDAGDRAAKRAGKPEGVRGAGATRVRLDDPLGEPGAFLYLYRSKGKLDGGAGEDYVSYEFALASGPYETTYRRHDGPNPESSRILTDAYEIGFSDRWFFDRLVISAGAAAATDVLDGFKFSFGPTSCGRSEATFNDAEGAFVANLDGPVRAVRSYVGANSGPLTQRTHLFYEDRHEIITDLRVHAVPGPLTYHDLSPAGVGMSYLNSANATPVSVDGSPDAVSEAVAQWHLWTGPQGSLFAADRLESSFADQLMAAASTWYLDDSTPEPNLQCWGDSVALGQAGLRSTASMPNTDPRTGGGDFLRTTTTEVLSAPGAGAAEAIRRSIALDAPLVPQTKPVRHG